MYWNRHSSQGRKESWLSHQDFGKFTKNVGENVREDLQLLICMCTCVWMAEDRFRCYFLGATPLFPSILSQGLSLDQSSEFRLGFLAIEFQRSARFCILSTGITSVWHYVRHQFSGSNSSPHTCQASTFHQPDSPAPTSSFSHLPCSWQLMLPHSFQGPGIIQGVT